ncbi:hypothetical protein Pla108_17750 [Botrimarina colliarenosi]|uniref:Uncharacterized protein n=1 Tax=Botrimarina colliarenosi TaxID=2528001 RepID=A0A5C6AHG6_9BACT|nr:choice-of-anchor tandem repeat GloVer-containing protein [Botrimarina colliarenosi]TWT97623.1 hypothetical protein Pla108_17750 [Botrimarina colliarenosi]
MIRLRCFIAAWLAVSASAFGAVTLFHEFDGTLGGRAPLDVPVLDSGVLYGVTSEGGNSGTGVLFRLDLSGGLFTKLHDFDAVSDPLGQGSLPAGSPTVVGSQLYGTTQFGGAAFDGVIYRIGLNGAGYSLVHEFDMDVAPAVAPVGSLVSSGGALFGSALFGSTQTEGALYSIAPDGSGFTLLHSLAGNGSEGEELAAAPTLVDDALWGVASFGGAFEGGILYRLTLNGATPAFSVMHGFGFSDDAQTPVGSLLNHNGWLYGVTQEGGADGLGAVFRFGLDGEGYERIYDFSGGAEDGATPQGSLTVVDGRLYGVAQSGGPSDSGVVFSINEDGSQRRIEHAFSGVDGSTPGAGLSYDGDRLYGVTSTGGGANAGVVFSLVPGALRGDYNGDGAVDAADYTVWRDTLNSSRDLRADGDFSGAVDAGDYTVWTANYGQSVGTTIAVPEPLAIVLLQVGLVGALERRRA